MRRSGFLFTSKGRSYIGRSAGLQACLLLLALAVCTPAPAFAQEPADLVEGRRLFDALEYDQALPFLDRAVGVLEPQAGRDSASRTALIAAFEMRARARFGIGNREGAVSDFRALLGLEPGFALADGVSPRVVAILDEVRIATIGAIELTLDPTDAQLAVDGVPRPFGNGRLAVAAGAHTLRVSRTGFGPIDQPVTVLAGQSLPLRIALQRTASVVTMVTTPPGAEVFVNGVSKGRTDQAAAGAAAIAAQLQVPVEQIAALVLTDMATGTFDVEFRRECYVTERRRISIAELGDHSVEPVTLKPSVGSLVLDSEPAGAAVLIDGDARGEAPATIDGVCAGTHVIEFRTSVGRAVERVALEPGASLTIRGRVRPAFALLAADAGAAADPRLAVERAFGAAETVVLYAPPADVLKEVIAQSGAAAEWFGVGAPDAKPPADLRDRLRRLADRLGAQGLAWVQPLRPGGTEVRLALLTPGSTDPDEITLSLDQPDSVKQALDRLQTPLVLTRGSLGAAVIDVLDVKGAIVMEVDPGQAAAEAGLAPGDLVQQLDGQAVDSALDLESKLGSRQPGQQVSLGVRKRAGQTQSLPVVLRRVPVLVTSSDRFRPANVTVAVLRAQMATTTDPALLPIVGLNLAAALLRAGDSAEALALLKDTTLPAGPGVSAGTVLYLLGEAALAQGDQTAARQAWDSASQADGRLTDDGPSVKALAARALARLK
ncbi:MAG: tetratricopeptide repeat protein [Vicinamibacteria bacterium]|nr:tetratricopeptide repeat protein [Vicinamibacteria bacterium]